MKASIILLGCVVSLQLAFIGHALWRVGEIADIWMRHTHPWWPACVTPKSLQYKIWDGILAEGYMAGVETRIQWHLFSSLSEARKDYPPLDNTEVPLSFSEGAVFVVRLTGRIRDIWDREKFDDVLVLFSAANPDIRFVAQARREITTCDIPIDKPR